MELVPGDSKVVDAAIARLEPGTLVTLTWIPGSDPMRVIAPAAKLRHVGLFVMPHMGARHLDSSAQLQDLAERLVGEAGVDRVLIIGGDRKRPAGPFDSALAVMQSGVFQRVGILRMAIAGFPEGNPHIPDAVLREALLAKVDFARREGLRLSIMTQFCFAAEPILNWLRGIRMQGIDVPIRIGLAGPGGVMTLVRYAVRCGVGNSLRVLTDNPSFARAAVDRGPEAIVREIAQSVAQNGDLGIEGLHFYLFGGFNKTFEWIHSAESRKSAPLHT